MKSHTLEAAVPNIRSMEVSATRVSITASNGNTATVTQAQIVGHYQSEVGSKAIRRAATILWFKQQVVAALGSDMISDLKMTFDFDDTDGTPLGLTINS